MNQVKHYWISPRERKKRKTRKLLFVLFVVVIIFAGAIFVLKHYNLKRTDVFSSVFFVNKVIEPKKDISELKSTVETIIAKYPNMEISVAFADQESDQIITMGKDKPFVAASTAKVLVATDYLTQVEKGKYSLTTPVAGVSARWQLRQMIQQSNNDSWMAFNSLLTYSQESAFAKSIGINSYNVKENTIKVSDQVLLLKKLYNGKLLNEENTSLLFYYMQNTNNEDLLASALPDDKVIHKYGALDGNLHDIGIVDGTKPFFIGVFTNGQILRADRPDIFKEIANAAKNYEYK